MVPWAILLTVNFFTPTSNLHALRITTPLKNRYFLVSEPDKHPQEFNHLTSVLISNGYQPKNNYRFISTERYSKSTAVPIAELPHSITYLSFIRYTTDCIARILKKHNVHTVFWTASIPCIYGNTYPRNRPQNIYISACLSTTNLHFGHEHSHDFDRSILLAFDKKRLQISALFSQGYPRGSVNF